MRRAAARARGRAIALRFQILWHGITIESSSEEVLAALAYMVQGAVHDFDPRRTMHYRVDGDAGGFTIWEGGDELCVVPDAVAVLDALYRRVHQRAFELASLLGWVRVHGALVTIGERRVALVGDAGVGKTTLAARLLHDGVTVHGDESFVTRAGVVAAVARPFHLKPGIEHYVPELVPALASLPRLEGDPPIHAFDPGRAGFRWHIDLAPLGDLVLVVRGEGPTELEAVRATEAMPAVVAQAFRNQERTSDLLGGLAAALRNARCWQLRLGEPGEAVRRLERMVALG